MFITHPVIVFIQTTRLQVLFETVQSCKRTRVVQALELSSYSAYGMSHTQVLVDNPCNSPEFFFRFHVLIPPLILGTSGSSALFSQLLKRAR